VYPGIYGRIPYEAEQGIFSPAQGINSRGREEAGNERDSAQNRSARPTHPITSKDFNVLDNKIFNNFVMGANALGFSGPAAPAMRVSSPGSDPQTAALGSGRHLTSVAVIVTVEVA